MSMIYQPELFRFCSKRADLLGVNLLNAGELIRKGLKIDDRGEIIQIDPVFFGIT